MVEQQRSETTTARALRSMPADQQLQLALLAGIAVVAGLWLSPVSLLPPVTTPWGIVQFLLLFPLLEEAVFRGLLQPAIYTRSGLHFGPLSLANLVTSLLFTGAHLLYHTPLWALAVFIPSLLFGYFYERYRNLLAPVLLHAAYNSFFLLATLSR